MAQREYEGAGIIVHWDSDRCIHSRLCALGLPQVFDFEARPWVNVDAAPPADTARVIDTCPSGALSYTRTDGVANGRRGRAPADDPAESIRSDDDAPPGPLRAVTLDLGSTLPIVTPLPDGPLVVDGPFGLANADGVVEIVERVTLCRCGHSGSKPHCDGSHERVGFTALGTVPPPERVSQVLIRPGRWPRPATRDA